MFYWYLVYELTESISNFFKPSQRQQDWACKPVKSFPIGNWWYLMVLCQLPSMTLLQRVPLCWVKGQCLQLLWIFISLKGTIVCWTKLFTFWKAAKGGVHFRHLQKTSLLSMHNDAGRFSGLFWPVCVQVAGGWLCDLTMRICTTACCHVHYYTRVYVRAGRNDKCELFKNKTWLSKISTNEISVASGSTLRLLHHVDSLNDFQVL